MIAGVPDVVAEVPDSQEFTGNFGSVQIIVATCVSSKLTIGTMLLKKMFA